MEIAEHSPHIGTGKAAQNIGTGLCGCLSAWTFPCKNLYLENLLFYCGIRRQITNGPRVAIASGVKMSKQLGDLLLAVYDAAFASDRWPNALDAYVRALEARGVLLVCADTAGLPYRVQE